MCQSVTKCIDKNLIVKYYSEHYGTSLIRVFRGHRAVSISGSRCGQKTVGIGAIQHFIQHINAAFGICMVHLAMNAPALRDAGAWEQCKF